MEDIQKYNLLENEVIQSRLGSITYLKSDIGITEHGSIHFEDKTLLANYIYNESSYNLVYTIVDPEGNVVDSFIEKEGILPILFKSPVNEIYVSITPYDPDKEMEISIPLFNRSLVEKAKLNRPFSGKYIGTVNQSAILYDIDIWSEKKPDKMLNIEFKNNQIKKKTNIKIDFPKDNKINIHDNEIHLIARENDIFIHRLIDETGREIRSRKVNHKEFFIREVIKLSFDDTSTLIHGEDDGKFMLLEIDNKGKISAKELINIQDEIFNTWPPVEIAEDTVVIRFNTEFGNGWFTLYQDKLIEFFYGKDIQEYKNLLTNEIFEIDRNDLVIASINKTKDNSYAVIFYPMADGERKNKELIILNRTIAG